MLSVILSENEYICKCELALLVTYRCGARGGGFGVFLGFTKMEENLFSTFPTLGAMSGEGLESLPPSGLASDDRWHHR